MSYYDFGDNKFYRLDAVLPIDKIRKLFSQQIFVRDGFDVSKSGLRQRYDSIVYGIGPKGYIVFWAQNSKGYRQDQIELGHYWARERPGLTVAQWNDNGGEGRHFPIRDRWVWLKIAVEPATLAKFKAGWAPDPDYYLHNEIKYPWYIMMTGNATLMNYTIRMANAESTHVFPWELLKTVANPVWQAVPVNIELFFMDKQGAWHQLYFNLFSHGRFGKNDRSEPDSTSIFKAFREIFPDITLDSKQNSLPRSDFAHIEVNMNDDLSGFSVYLVKGDKRIELPVDQDSVDFNDVKPYANFSYQDPIPAEVEWNKYGPNGHP